jgi:hypothetical protein
LAKGSRAGAAQWKIRWQPPPLVVGYIIQKTVQQVDVRDCQGNPVQPTRNRSIAFWEAWPVTNGAAQPPFDNWQTRNENQETQGSIQMDATYEFFPNYQLDNTWLRQNQPGYVEEAGGAPVQPGNASPVSFDNLAIHRSLSISWNDCENAPGGKRRTEINVKRK